MSFLSYTGYLFLITLLFTFVSYFVLVIASAPGAFLYTAITDIHKTDRFDVLEPQKLKKRWYLCLFVSFICQTFVYLIYVAFIVDRTSYNISNGLSLFVWIPAFIAAILPIFITMIRFQGSKKTDYRESMSSSMDAAIFTFVVAILGFFVFVIVPEIMYKMYSWIL